MSHNRDHVFRDYYEYVTVAQLLLIDDNVISYIRLTSPFGDGDSDGKRKPPKHTVEPTISDARRLNSHGPLKDSVLIEQTERGRLPVHLQDQISDFIANEKGGKR